MASRSWNRVELIGNLTRDPELRFTPSGAAVCTFGVATNRTYVSEGERKEEVDFHRLVAWNKLAELCNQLLKKGHRVFISGRLQTRSWEAQDGQTRTITEIVIEDMILLTPKASAEYRETEEVPPPPKESLPDAEELKEESQKVSKSEEAAQKVEEEPKEKKTEAKAPQEDIKEDEDLPF